LILAGFVSICSPWSIDQTIRGIAQVLGSHGIPVNADSVLAVIGELLGAAEGEKVAKSVLL
jgi:hypothetical protein